MYYKYIHITYNVNVTSPAAAAEHKNMKRKSRKSRKK